MRLETVNLIGALSAVLVFGLTILIFGARLVGAPRLEHHLGLAVIALIVPLVVLLLVARGHARSPLYFLQISLMILFLVVELLLDYVLKIEFRGVRWMTVAYVTLFFAATGGMLGVASHAGRPWSYSSIVLFLVMAALAFVQRARTGM
jgi:hypothetical protein